MAIVFSGVVSAQQIAAIAKKGTNFGFIDKTGKWVIEPKYQALQTFKGEFALAKINNLWGVINKQGEWVIKAQYQSLKIPRNGYAMAKQKDEWKVVDDMGETVYQNTEYKKIDKLGNGILIGYQKKYADYIDVSTGKIIATPIQTKALYKFSEGLARFKGKKWGYIDKTGKYAIPPQFDEVKDFINSKAMVKKDEKWGQIDKTGNWIIKAEFDLIKGFKKGKALAKQNGKYGIIDEKGSWVIKPLYEKLRHFNSGLAFATKEGVVGYVNESGEFKLPPANIARAYPFSDGYAMVRVDETIGYMNTDMKIIIAPKYVKALDWGGPFGRVMINEKWTFVNASGEELEIARAQKLYKFHGGLAAIKAGDKYGYINESGEIVILISYTNIEDEFLYNAMSNSGWGMTARPVFEEPSRDKFGVIIVKKRTKYGVLDKSGNILAPFEFDDIRAFYPF